MPYIDPLAAVSPQGSVVSPDLFEAEKASVERAVGMRNIRTAGIGGGGVSLGSGGRPEPPGILPALPGAVGAAAGALGLTMPAWLTAILGVGAAGYGAYQALGGGEGEGLFGLNVLGGDDFELGGVEFGGPGLPEPVPEYTEWHAGNKQFYYVPRYTSTGKRNGGTVFMYNRDTKRWKWWRLPKPQLAVIGKNMPSHRMLTRLRRNLKRQIADAETVLKFAAPHKLERTKRPGGRYVRRRGRRYID